MEINMKNLKNLTLAFVYNVRHQYPSLDDPRTQLETDFDDQITIDNIVLHLRRLVKRVIPIEANKEAYLKLYQYRKEIDLVFNYSEGIYGKDRYVHLPAMLEMLELPFTGASPLTQGLILNKPKMKEVLLSRQIPTLPFQLFTSHKETLAYGLNFPLIVKPSARGSSAGIINSSIVHNPRSLKKQVQWVLQTFNEPAFVEPFLTGREFSVPLIGNPPQVLPFIEPNHQLLPKKYYPIDSFEVKWFVEEEGPSNHLVCPAQLPKKLHAKITAVCLAAWKALGLQDWCRMDVRCDTQGQPYILDINHPAGLIPPEVSVSSYLPLSARAAKIDFDTLLTLIINSALKRIYGKNYS